MNYYPITYHDPFVPRTEFRLLVKHENVVNMNDVLRDCIKEAVKAGIDTYDNLENLLTKRGFIIVNTQGYSELVAADDPDEYEVFD